MIREQMRPKIHTSYENNKRLSTQRYTLFNTSTQWFLYNPQPNYINWTLFFLMFVQKGGWGIDQTHGYTTHYVNPGSSGGVYLSTRMSWLLTDYNHRFFPPTREGRYLLISLPPSLPTYLPPSLPSSLPYHLTTFLSTYLPCFLPAITYINITNTNSYTLCPFLSAAPA